MEILLLGTGSADGWPSPFCGCASCAAAQGNVRGQTAALVDQTLMLDCGPEAPRAAVRAGHTLAHVRHILFTHGHPDHVGPAALLFRHWAGRAEPLDLVGPKEALDQCRDWVGPEDPVRFIEVAPGDVVELTSERGDYLVRVLEAAHPSVLGGGAVLYDVETTGSGARRLLWATDTGPLPAQTHAAIAGAGFDAVFLEETFGHLRGHDGADHHRGHHDLETFPRTLAQLRESGAVTAATEVVAVHLSHHNPPPNELAEILRGWGARAGEDGEIMRLGHGGARPVADVGRTLVLGGVRSGKSVHAEELLAAEPAVMYLATGGSGRDDAEWAARVGLHQQRRPATWRTAETVEVAELLRTAETPILLDCLGTWLTARIDLREAWDGGPIELVEDDMRELVAAWRACPVRAVAVSNEVGSGVVPATASGRLFRDLLGKLNSQMAAESEHVVLVVAGIPVPLRG